MIYPEKNLIEINLFKKAGKYQGEVVEKSSKIGVSADFFQSLPKKAGDIC